MVGMAFSTDLLFRFAYRFSHSWQNDSIFRRQKHGGTMTNSSLLTPIGILLLSLSLILIIGLCTLVCQTLFQILQIYQDVVKSVNRK